MEGKGTYHSESSSHGSVLNCTVISAACIVYRAALFMSYQSRKHASLSKLRSQDVVRFYKFNMVLRS